MGDDDGCCVKLFRMAFILFNVVFLLLGLGVLAVGIYLIVTAQTLDFVTGIEYANGAILLIVAGVVTALIAALGFIGACLKWRPLLAIYVVVLVVIIILEIVAGGLSFYYEGTFIMESESRYREGLMRAIMEYNDSEANMVALDTFQSTLSCCGIDNASDWAIFNPTYIIQNSLSLPESCECTVGEDADCDMVEVIDTTNNITFTQNAYNRGCFDAVMDASELIAAVAGGVGIAIGIIEVLGVVIGLGLICCITKNKSDDKYV